METGTPYCGPPPAPGDVWLSWNLDPPLIGALGLLLVWGLMRSDRRPAFVLGWLALVVAFVSPLCALTTALFSARALHHLVVLGVAAPLLALARPLRPIPAPLSFGVAAAGLILWHLPPVYTLAWDHAAGYWALQLALLLPGWALWSALVHPVRDSAGTFVVQAMLVGALAGVMGLIGAILTFAPGLLYHEHHSAPLAWGLDPLADQQLAGLVMWVPGMIPLAITATMLARRGWQRSEWA